MVPPDQGPPARNASLNRPTPRSPAASASAARAVARPRRSPLRVIGRLVAIGCTLGLVAAILGAAFAYHSVQALSEDLPTVDGLRQYQPPVMSRIYSGDERLIAELAKERRIFVPFTAIPDVVRQAFVSAEDQNFWTHKGVDPGAIARAAFTDLIQIGHNRRPIGASTITQQVARNMLLGTNERTFARKVKEAVLAMRVEASLSKERILELYLNEIYFGLQSYGVAAAAQTYFNKPLDQITLAEAAFLASLPKAPNNYNPFRFPEAARARRDWVLDRMVDDHAITAEQAAAAKAGPVVTGQFHRPEIVAGSEWFGEEVRRQMVERFGADATTEGGLAVRTSLDPALQATADQVLRRGLITYDRQHGGWRGPVARVDATGGVRSNWARSLAALPRPPGMLPDWRLAVVLEVGGGDAKLGWLDESNAPRIGAMLLSETGWARPNHNGALGAAPRKMADVVQVGDVVMAEPATGAKVGGMALRQVPQVQGALVSLDPLTGRVLAMSGGWSYEASQFNRATQAERQPGSSFKPMVYLAAMQQNIPPSQKALDAPFVLDQGAAGVWKPGNYETGFLGPVSLHVALEKSLNLPTVRLAQKVGMDAVAANAIAFHVVDQMSHYLPNALGAVDTTVLRQAGAYASLDMGGREVVPTLIDSVQDRDGHVIWRAPGEACSGCSNPRVPPMLSDTHKQLADPLSVFQVVAMMEGVVQHGTGYEAAKGLGRPVAGKTGTTQDFNDAWFVGFTPDLVTAVWIGFDTPSSLGDKETGGAIAAPIWHDFMAAALKNRPNLPFHTPDGLTMASWAPNITDAFKVGQVPGDSGPTIGGDAGGEGGGGGAGAGVTASTLGSGTGTGVDSGVGGLY